MTNGISGKTKICGIIADPVEHTMSPAMHNAAFRKLGLDYAYVPFNVKKEDLCRAVAGLRALNTRGFNVTIPHKMAVMEYLDRVDLIARKIGAVNTVVNENGILAGYNTDATGFLQSLLEAGIEPKGKNVILLGAGGAARAIAFILVEQGATLTILNRHADRAGELVKIAGGEKAGGLTPDGLAHALPSADILINTTSVGMYPYPVETPVPADLLTAKLVVADIVYNPVETCLIREAKAVGAKTVSGVAMLVWQGAQAFEKWTGVKAPVDIMRAEVLKGLGHEK